MNLKNIRLSGSDLKIIAVIAMFLDHLAATVLVRCLVTGVFWDQAAWYEVYQVMRNIGRVAFPIYCFLLVEGFIHTSDRRKYALRLFLFALISEIPFDLAFNAQVLEFGYQNVFFTLWLGLLLMMAIDAVERHTEQQFLRFFYTAALIIGTMFAAHLLKTDYSYYGIMCIAALYLFRGSRLLQVLAGCLVFFWWELPAIAAFAPIYLYSGERGSRMKYFFYIFYPAHLMILYVVCVFLGSAGVSVV